MTYLIMQILVCLLLAALFGFLIGWALRGSSCSKQLAELETTWSQKLAAAAAAGAQRERDDLRIIEGIGPKIEKLLNDDQIFTFAELAAAPRTTCTASCVRPATASGCTTRRPGRTRCSSPPRGDGRSSTTSRTR